MKYLDSNPPVVEKQEAARWLREHYGLERDLTALYSDRDQNFLVGGEVGDRYLLKIYNEVEDQAAVDFQIAALEHLSALNLPRPKTPAAVTNLSGEAYCRVTSENGSEHFIRLISFLEGDLCEKAQMTPAFIQSFGALIAQLDIGLRAFFHSAAGQKIVWDSRIAETLVAETQHIENAQWRRLASEALNRYASEIAPKLKGLRAQIIHNDVTTVNALFDPNQPDEAIGIFDFGDMIHGPLVLELAVTGADILTACDADLEALGQLTRGFDSVIPLEEEEIDVLFDLVLLRLACCGTITAWRAARSADRDNYLLDYLEPSFKALESLSAINRLEARAFLRRLCRMPEDEHDPSGTADLLEARQKSYGDGHGLFYQSPLHLVRGAGVYLFDKEGRRYLDSYNNVPHVGHEHPHVINAVRRQVAKLNTNSRYLYRPLGAYAERLTSLFPDPLNLCILLSSGSEANDLALRLARAWSGHHGALVMNDAYHGVTDQVTGLSPIETPGKENADWVETVIPPYAYRAAQGENIAVSSLASVEGAIAKLDERGHGTALVMIDSGLTSSGVLDMPEGYLAQIYEKVRKAGGLCVSDEVQYGFGRCGDNWWGYESQNVVPDIVTIGKPAANGMPLSAVITSHEIFERFKEESYFFSSVGGNPVSCAAGMAVLDILEDEDLTSQARRVGSNLRKGLLDLAKRHAVIGDIRGRGLLQAIEFVKPEDQSPDAGLTHNVIESLLSKNILAGKEGLAGNIIKIRPPMVFTEAHVDHFLNRLDQVLKEMSDPL